MIKLGNKVLVSDPCYEVNTWCTAQVTDAVAGNYNTFVKYKELRNWGKRVSQLLAIHEAFTENELTWKKTDYDIGVDSGTCGIFDYNSVKDIIGAIDGNEESERFYDEADPLNDDQMIETRGFGVVSRSGLGDGSYTLYLGYEPSGNLVGFKIDYFNDCDSEELDSEIG